MAFFGGDEGRSAASEDLRLFAVMTAIAELFGLLSVILMCAWLSNYYDGFSFQSSDTKFNLHPLLMTFAFIFLFGNGIMIFRVFRRLSKIRVKIAHAVIEILVFVIAVIAVRIAWSGHDEDNESKASAILTSRPGSLARIHKRHAGMHEDEGEGVHLANLHAWLGLMTVILFSAQWICGFVSFLYPQLRFSVRQAYMPLHIFWGGTIFVLGALSAITGIVMFSSQYAVSHKLASFNGETWIVNSLGICIVAYVVSILFILFQPSYKRRALPEEDDKIPLTGMDSNE